MHRSEITIDLGAVRHNVRRLLDALAGSQLWAVVKADAYGHGAVEVARVALEEGARALCVATVGEGVALRSAFPDARILVMGPSGDDDIGRARDARLELAVSEPPFPEGVPLHLKLDTGMGRFGARALSEPPPERRRADEPSRDRGPGSGVRRAPARALSRGGCRAASSWRPTSRTAQPRCGCPQFAGFAAARCGIALYGLSPFQRAPVLGRPRARPVVAELARTGEAPRRGREHRLRPPLRGRAADVDRARARRLRGRLPQGPHRDPGARRRRAPPGRRHRVDGLVRGRAARGAASRHSRHARSATGCSSRATPREPGRSTTRSRPASGPPPSEPGACSSMADLTDRLREALAGGEGWLVGGALRDELLGRPVVDLDVACREPELAARAFARASGGAPFPLSERHGAWRIALEDGRTVDFTPLAAGIEDDLGDPRLHAQRHGAPRRRRRPRRSLRRAGGHRRAHDSCGRARRLRGRSAAPAAGGPARGRARLPLRRRDGGARPPACVPCGAARRASGSSASSNASRRRASAGSRSSGCSRRSAAPTGSSTGSTRSTPPTTGSCAPSATALGEPSDLAQPRPVRAHAAPRRASGRRLRARDPPLSARDGAVGAPTRSRSSG